MHSVSKKYEKLQFQFVIEIKIYFKLNSAQLANLEI